MVPRSQKKFTLAGDYAGLGLELPLTQKHKAAWSIALAVAMSAEIRLSQPDAQGLADVEAAQLKFRYVVGQLEASLWGI